jgi:CarD family transcriptional regulator
MSGHYNKRCFHGHMNQFEIGDKVVYPNHGVGIIEKISNRLVAGKFERFYLLRICSNDILVMVPTVNAGDVGLRKIIDRKDVNQLLNYLANDKFFTQRDWKDRFKENSERMRSGSIFHVAEVFKNLVHLSRVKPLSFREKRMLDRARFLLISELSTVMNLREVEIEARIEKAVTKACGKGPAPAAEA